MSEKVIFEYRAWHDQDGQHYETNLGDWQSIFPLHANQCSRQQPKRAHKRHNRAHRHMRKALDFYERMYAELFGDADTAESDT